MMAYFCYHLSDNNVDSSDDADDVDLSVIILGLLWVWVLWVWGLLFLKNELSILVADILF